MTRCKCFYGLIAASAHAFSLPTSPTPHMVSSFIVDDDSHARSMFGTQQYWNDVYQGQGDVPADAYSWYGLHWHDLRRHVQPFVSPTHRILLPGIGNDVLLVDLLRAGYGRHGMIVAQDYSMPALERQVELIEAHGFASPQYSFTNDNESPIQLSCSNVIHGLPMEWQDYFDVILEKGLLDAVYLSDETTENMQKAIQNLKQALKIGGIFVSVSAVIPQDDRRAFWQDKDWEWIRDGHADTEKAGCFIFRKLR
jgi:SAM-dependent methyltransferase